MKIKVDINDKVYYLNEDMKFTQDPYIFQFISVTPDTSDKIKPNVFSLISSNKAIKIYKTNEKEENQEEGEKKDSSEVEKTNEGWKKLDVAKTDNTPGTEKPEIEETTTGDVTKSDIIQQWTITPIISKPLIARINVGTDCLRVDPDALMMIRGECPKVESLKNDEYNFEIDLKERDDLSRLPKLKSNNKDLNKDSGEKEKHVRSKHTKKGERKGKEHRPKKTRENKQETENVESEVDSGFETENDFSNEEESMNIKESTASTEVEPKAKDTNELVSGNKPFFMEVEEEGGKTQKIPVTFKSVKTDNGDPVISPVVDEGKKETLPSKSKPSTNKKPMKRQNVSHSKRKSPGHKKNEPGSSPEELIKLSVADKNGKSIVVFVSPDKIKTSGRPLHTSTEIRSPADSSKPELSKISSEPRNKKEEHVPVGEVVSNPEENTKALQKLKKVLEGIKGSLEEINTSNNPKESLTSNLLYNRLKKDDISTNNKKTGDTFHKSLKDDPVSLLSSLKNSVSGLIQTVT